MDMIRYLSKVRKLLAEEGWVQGKSRSPHGYCLSGALSHGVHSIVCKDEPDAARCTGDTKRLYNLFKAEIQERMPPGSWGIISIERWNDDSKRTYEEVLGLVDVMIDKCRVEAVIEESKDIEIQKAVTV